MVYWICSFKIPTKNASRFLIAAKKVIKETCSLDWTPHNDVGKRITKIHFYSPTFGYRVDLRTPLEVIREAERQFHRMVSETEKALLELAEKHDALVEVFNGGRTEKYVQAKAIREAEVVERKVVETVAKTLKNIKPEVEKYQDILSLDGIIEEAKKHL